jgi:hypothetical protein
MLNVKGLCAFALSLGLATVAFSAPSLLGPTGLLFTPTADTLQVDENNLAVNHIAHLDNVQSTANLGVYPGLEVGFAGLAGSDTIINGKYSFQQEAAGKPGIAFGVLDLTGQLHTTLYAVASKRFSPAELYGIDNFRANLGLAGGGSDDTIPLSGLFGGISFDVAQRATVMLEHDGKSFNFGARGVVLRTTSSNKLQHDLIAQIGSVGKGHDFTFGLSYDSHF